MLEPFGISATKVPGRPTPTRKDEFAQFMTPGRIARFMASLFPPSTTRTCRLLDAGAGMGSLTRAFLDRWLDCGFQFEHVEAEAYEVDPAMRTRLEVNLNPYAAQLPFQFQSVSGDFIDHAVRLIGQGRPPFTHAILNPPYKKINSRSHQRLALRHVGIETVNLYTGFVALAVLLLDQGGQLVAIIPRSFCNGPYYRHFRKFILSRAALRHMHLFESRKNAFKKDAVLQENIIILLERGVEQGEVTVSTSTDDRLNDYIAHSYSFHQIVRNEDVEYFIHVPKSPESNTIDLAPEICFTLAELDIEVSTGPVVDFRVREYLKSMPEQHTVPLLYPGHFSGGALKWPKQGYKKPNALENNSITSKLLYPNGYYTIIRRFSAKEERRRINASVVSPASFPGASALGFENHLNVFHYHRQGLHPALAHGLAAYLNSTAVDDYFRLFNGHTQVNATDLRAIKYPSRDALLALGEWAKHQVKLTQTMIDEHVETLLR